MAVYFVGTSLSILFAYIALKLKNYGRLFIAERQIMYKLFAFLSFIPLTFIMGVRYNVGTDYGSYYRFFYSMPKYVESGYRLLNEILKKFTSDPQSIFIVSAIIICGSYYFIIYKESISPVYSILLFVLCKDYFIAMNGMRQYIATAIMILALPYMKEKKVIKSLPFFIIAFLFHKSVVIFIPLYILYNVNIPPLRSGIIVIVIYLLSFTIRGFILPYLARFGFYSNYFTNSYANKTENFNWAYMLIFLSFFLLLAYEYESVKNSKELKLLYSAVTLCLFVMSLSAVMPSNIHRLTWHMNSFIVMYVPLAIKNLNLKISKTSISNIVAVVILVAYVGIIINDFSIGKQDVIPYQTMWSR